MVKKKVLIAARTKCKVPMDWNRHIDYFWDIADDYKDNAKTESIDGLSGLFDIDFIMPIQLYLENCND